MTKNAPLPLTCCIGAGPAGLTAAYHLAQQGYPVVVLESDTNYVGGISRTVRKDGFCVDIGGHRFFSKSEEIVALWKEILGEDLLVRKRRSHIIYRGKRYPYPLSIYSTLRNLGLIESCLCGLSYLRARLFPIRPAASFADWVTNQFGVRLFRTFFKTYTEKVWGIRCEHISADWARQRIKNLSLTTAVMHAIAKTMRINTPNTVKSLIEQFYYPRYGPGQLWETAATKINAMGGQVRLGATVTSLIYDAEHGRWRIGYETAHGPAWLQAEHIISSMPLTQLTQVIAHTPQDIRTHAGALHYRDFLIVALILRDRDAIADNWLYVHDPGVKVGRIQNFKAWSPNMVPDDALTCYGMEYFCFAGDALWTSSDDALVALASDELVTLGLVNREDIIRGHVVRQPKAYPVYDHQYETHVTAIAAWLSEACPNLQTVGRNGMHHYNNQDHSMMTALLAARNIAEPTMRYDVWSVNQDAEYHEIQQSQRQIPRSLLTQEE